MKKIFSLRVKAIAVWAVAMFFCYSGCEKKQASDVQAVSVENVRVVSDSKSDALTEKINMDNTDVVETIGIISFAADPVANKKYILAEDGGVIASFGYEIFPYDKRDIKVFKKAVFDNGSMLGLEIKEKRI